MSSAQDKLSIGVASGVVNHAYIVVSSSGDMPAILRQCAKILLCNDNGCNQCATCAKIDKGVHNDNIVLPRDKVKNKILVDDIAYLIEESYKRPVDNSSCRVFTIDATNSMGSTGATLWQNKLLKTLEEPVGNTHILIGVRNSAGVLPTVLSRCQLLQDEGAGYTATYNALLASGFRPDIASMASALSEGNVNSAMAIVADPSYYSLYQLLQDMLCNMHNTSASLEYVSKILSQDSYQDKLLLTLTTLLHEAIVCRVDSRLLTLQLQPAILEGICSNYSIRACTNIIGMINTANRQLTNGGNYTVIVDKLIVNMLEEKYRCRI